MPKPKAFSDCPRCKGEGYIYVKAFVFTDRTGKDWRGTHRERCYECVRRMRRERYLKSKGRNQ